MTEITIRVPWADADAADVVWFGNYLRYVDRAEQDLLLALGLTHARLDRELAVLLPRTRFECVYRSPARIGDELVVALWVVDVTPRRVRLRFAIRDRASHRPVAEGRYAIACVARVSFEPMEFPDAIRHALEAVRRADDRSEAPAPD